MQRRQVHRMASDLIEVGEKWQEQVTNPVLAGRVDALAQLVQTSPQPVLCADAFDHRIALQHSQDAERGRLTQLSPAGKFADAERAAAVLAQGGEQTKCFVDGRPVVADRLDGGRSHAVRNLHGQDRAVNSSWPRGHFYANSSTMAALSGRPHRCGYPMPYPRPYLSFTRSWRGRRDTQR